MPRRNSSPPSSLVDRCFFSMEEVNEVSRKIGQEGEFRQLGKGRVTNRWRLFHLGRYLLTSNRLDKHICAHLTPPKGYVALGIVPPPYSLLVNGVEIGNQKTYLIDANSEADFVTPGEIECQTLFVPKSDLEERARALHPRKPANGAPVRIVECSSSEWSTLLGEMGKVLRHGTLSPEDFYHLVSRFLCLMTGGPEKSRGEIYLSNRSTARVAKRGREYIEDHFPHTIRMEDLCHHTGVSVRTLQRSFAEYFQVSPLEYVKARRLDAARKALLSGDSSRNQVTLIALDNGFTHFGRFSVEYRAHFGESPKQTLARRMPSQFTNLPFNW